MPLSLASATTNQLLKKKAPFGIARLGDGDSVEEIMVLQYFPETLSSTKAVNWSPKDIAGGSLPIYQWGSSGEHAISFTAVFHADVDHLAQGLDKASGRYEDVKSAGVLRRNPDVRTALVALRQFMFPQYSGDTETGSPQTKAPPKAMLVIPNSKLGLCGGFVDPTGLAGDTILCLMTQCDITIDSWFPSGNIRLATVSLNFVETPQRGGGVLFPQRYAGSVLGGVDLGGGERLFPYPDVRR